MVNRPEQQLLHRKTWVWSRVQYCLAVLVVPLGLVACDSQFGPWAGASPHSISAHDVLAVGVSGTDAQRVCDELFGDLSSLRSTFNLPSDISDTDQPADVGTTGLQCNYVSSTLLLGFYLEKNYYNEADRAGTTVNGGYEAQVDAGIYDVRLILNVPTSNDRAMTTLVLAANRLTDIDS